MENGIMEDALISKFLFVCKVQYPPVLSSEK